MNTQTILLQLKAERDRLNEAINALGGFLRGERDGFVMKLSPDAKTVVYSSYLGGFGAEGATSIAVDDAGNAYVTGYTSSSDFPLAVDTMFQGAPGDHTSGNAITPIFLQTLLRGTNRLDR